MSHIKLPKRKLMAQVAGTFLVDGGQNKHQQNRITPKESS
jgi:hypothetical protein